MSPKNEYSALHRTRPWPTGATLIAIATFGAAALASGACLAQSGWKPHKPIRLIVPYPAGGGTDVLARQIGQRLTGAFGQQVVVDNRPGAGATVGTQIAARAQADGHTLLMATAPNAIAVSVYATLPFDLLRDFAPVASLAATAFLVVVHPALKASTPAELVALARAKPGSINFGSSGNGTVPHLAMELVKANAGIDLVHVPYKGAAPAIADLLGGQVQLMAIDISLVLPHVRAGRLRALAVTSAARSPVVPDLPTMAESGLPGYEIVSWYGVLAPAKTPELALKQLNHDLVHAISHPELREQLRAQGVDPMTGTPGEFGSFLRAEIVKFSRLVKQSGARPD